MPDVVIPMRRTLALALLALAACSTSAKPNAPVPAAPTPLRGLVLERLSGHADRVVSALEPRYATLDPAALVELARAYTALGRTADATRAYTDATHFAGRGHWQWMTGSDGARGVAISPDATQIATLDNSGAVRVWNPSSGDLVWSDTFDSGTELRLTPDGRWLVAGTTHVRVWDLATGARSLDVDSTSGIGVTPDSHLVIDQSGKKLVEVDPATGKTLHSFDTDGGYYHPAASRDRVASATHEGVVVRDRLTGKQLALLPLKATPDQVAMAPDGRVFVAHDGRISEYGTDGKVLHGYAGRFGALSADGTRLAVYAPKGRVALYDTSTGQELRAIPTGGAIALDAHGEVLVAASPAGISTWSVDTGAATATLPLGRYDIAGLAFDASGQRLAVTAPFGAAVWDLATGAMTPVLANGRGWSVGFAPDGTLAMASYDDKNEVTVGEYTVGEAIPKWTHATAALQSMSFRGGTLVGTFIDRTVEWDATGTKTELATHEIDAWSADGATGLHKTNDDGYMLGPVAKPTTKLFEVWGGTNDMVMAAAFSPGPRAQIALGDGGGRLSLWDVKSGEPDLVLVDDRMIGYLAWSPSGDLVATASDRGLHVWDAATGARREGFELEGEIGGVAFRPDGRVLAVVRRDNVVELFAVATGARIAMLAAPEETRGLVMGGDGRASGTLAANDPMVWRAHGIAMPAQGAWAGAVADHLLPDLLAQVPAETAPRADAPGVVALPAPRTCVPAGEKRLTVAYGSGATASICVAEGFGNGDEDKKPPVCFDIASATGTFTPRRPTTREVLERPVSRETGATATVDGTKVTVCKSGGGACKTFTAKGIEKLEKLETAVDPAGTSFVAVDSSWSAATPVTIYDVATGKVRATVPPSSSTGDRDGVRNLWFAGDHLVVWSTPCAGPCTTGRVIDVKTGKVITEIAGTGSNPALVAGDVWAVADAVNHALVFQDLGTGKVVKTLKLDSDGPNADMSLEGPTLVHVDGGVVVARIADHVGDIIVVDAKGKMKPYSAPACPAEP